MIWPFICQVEIVTRKIHFLFLMINSSLISLNSLWIVNESGPESDCLTINPHPNHQINGIYGILS